MASLRHIFTIIALMIWSHASADIFDMMPSESQVLEGYDYNNVITRMKQSPLHNIEGVWQFLDSGTKIAIEQANDDVANSPLHQYLYRIVIIKADQLSISSGTVMGYLRATAKQGYYDAQIYTHHGLEGFLSIPKTFTLILDDNTLVFNEYKTEIKINLWRLIPYIYRVGVSVKDTRPKGLDGCVRIYPQSKPLTPRYL